MHTKRPLLPMRAISTTITGNRRSKEHPRGRPRASGPADRTKERSRTPSCPRRPRGAGEGLAGRWSPPAGAQGLDTGAAGLQGELRVLLPINRRDPGSTPNRQNLISCDGKELSSVSPGDDRW